MIGSSNKREANLIKNDYKLGSSLNNVFVGEVVSVIDPNYLGRIQVRIKGATGKGGDDGISDKDLPWCFPMIPKFLGVIPKIKEAVYLFVFNTDKQHADRLYFGPIISQPQQLKFDPYYYSALAGFSFGAEAPTTNPIMDPLIVGVFPDQKYITIQGRSNTDIIQKDNEVLIRSGKFVLTNDNDFGLKFNNLTQGYIQIKNDVSLTNSSDIKFKGTVTNVVSNKINLITHSGDKSYDIIAQNAENDPISDEVMTKLIDEAQQLPFGNILLEYLILLKNAFLSHVHNGNGNQPTDLTISGDKKPLSIFKTQAENLESRMLSKNIRIN